MKKSDIKSAIKGVMKESLTRYSPQTYKKVMLMIIDQSVWRSREWGNDLIKGQFKYFGFPYTREHIIELFAYAQSDEGINTFKNIIKKNKHYFEWFSPELDYEDAIKMAYDDEYGLFGESSENDELSMSDSQQKTESINPKWDPKKGLKVDLPKPTKTNSPKVPTKTPKDLKYQKGGAFDKPTKIPPKPKNESSTGGASPLSFNDVKKLVWNELQYNLDSDDNDDQYNNVKNDVKGAKSIEDILNILEDFGDDPMMILLSIIIERPKSKSRFKP